MQVPVRNETLDPPGVTVTEGRDMPVNLGPRGQMWVSERAVKSSSKEQQVLRLGGESSGGGGHSGAGSGPCWVTNSNCNSLLGKC